MKFSESWLRQSVNPSISVENLVAQLTMAGLEVDGIEAASPSISGVVVVEIIGIEKHPDADKLNVCQVSDGQEQFQVVCGAPNARAGIKVPFARVGTVLLGDFKIKKAKLRGVDSFGMLCAQDELGLGDYASGLWELPLDAPVGDDLIEYLDLDDNIIEVDLTPNRGDCLSIRGLAREVGVLNQLEVVVQGCPPVPPNRDDIFDIQIKAPNACAKYAGRVIRNLDLGKSTPNWMQERLRRSGIRSLGPAVDVTNYVLLELGQPMHAFDASKIDGGIIIRMGNNESLKLLDDSVVIADQKTLVIADHSKVLALAGIMGGAEAAVSDNTTDILLESAWFNPIAIAGKARHYGKHTDSSHRFERGVDSKLQVAALERATALMIEICGGLAGPVVVEKSLENLPMPAQITLRDERLTQQLGVSIPEKDTNDMLTRLGLSLVERTVDAGIWIVPSWRFDLTIEQDLVEEVARIYGYNNLPTSTPMMALDLAPNLECKGDAGLFRSQLIGRGYQEVITYSFIDPDLQKLIDPNVDPVLLTNPIASDMAVMRTSLWPGLLSTAVYNLNRQQSRVRIFEVGQCFIQNNNSDSVFVQNNSLSGLICGARTPVGWFSVDAAVDFFDIKGDLESLIGLTGLASEFTYASHQHPALHPGQSAKIFRKSEHVGWIGQIHPEIQQQLGLSMPAFIFQVDLDKLTECHVPIYSEVSKFPEVRRDLAFFVDPLVQASVLMDCARDASGKLLIDLKLFDVYQGKDADNKGKSLALGLTFQHGSRTLTDEEVNQSVDNVASRLADEFDAEFRG